MESRKVLRPTTSNRLKPKENDNGAKPRTSTPVKENSSVIEPNISRISTATGTASKNKNVTSKSDKENVDSESGDVNAPLIELKTTMLQRGWLFDQQKEQLQEISKQITELREKLEEEKKEVHATITALKEISCVEKRFRVEQEKELLNSDSDEHLQEYFDQLMTVVNYERSKLELKNIASISDDQFKDLLSKADASLKLFNEGKDHETVLKLASFLPALEESLEKCNTSNQKCDEITQSIQRLLLHRNTLKSINKTNN